MRGSILTALACATAVLGATQASAATFTLNETIDLTKPASPGGSGWITGFAGFPDAWSSPVDLFVSPGDAIDLKAMFLPGQTLTTNWLSEVGVDFESNTAKVRVAGLTSGTLSLLDADGNTIAVSNVVENNVGGNIVGEFNATSFTGGMPLVTYSGFEYKVDVLTVTDIDFGQPPGTVTSEFDAAGFSMVNISPDAIPEPASWALMLTGFAGLGAALRSRRGDPADHIRSHGSQPRI